MILNLLKRWLLGEPPLQIEHPVLGKGSLIETDTGAYWEFEPMVDGKTLGLGVETTNEQEPTEAQLAFFHRYARDPDAAFAFASSSLTAEYERWMKQPFPAQWTTAFEFVGLTVPMDADPQHPWNLAFDCLTDPARHMFTCYVEHGKPSYVSVDG
jgi:hypothetical protein